MHSHLSFEEVLAYQDIAKLVTQPLDDAFRELDGKSNQILRSRLESYRDLLPTTPLSNVDQKLLEEFLHHGFVSADPNFLTDVVPVIQATRNQDQPILIQGETGTGKEVLVDCIHKTGSRSNGPLVKFNCSAIPDQLVESELFGHIRGAFSDAKTDRQGAFRTAHAGVIFLDEIGDLPLGVQAKLLRVLQDGSVRPLGEDKEEKVDVKVVSASNRDLLDMVKKKTFREDLYHRLHGMKVTLLPLYLRPGDLIPLLINGIRKYNQTAEKEIRWVGNWTIFELFTYRWPGNVRELEHVIHQACTISQCDQNLIYLGVARNIVESGFEFIDEVIPHMQASHAPDQLESAVPNLLSDLDRALPQSEQGYWHLSSRLKRYAEFLCPADTVSPLAAIGKSVPQPQTLAQPGADRDRYAPIFDLTFEEVKRVYTQGLIDRHQTIKTAAQAAGVNRDTFSKWKRTYCV